MTPLFAWAVVLGAACAAGALAAAFAPPGRAAAVTAFGGVACGVAFIGLGIAALNATTPEIRVLWAIPAIGPLTFGGDPLSGVFLLVSGLVVVPASVFAGAALKPLEGRHALRLYAVTYFALLASIGWLLLAEDVFSFFVAWEIMSILCYLLVTFDHSVAAHRSAGYLMLVVGEAGALAAIAGLLLLGIHAGSLGFGEIKAAGGTIGAGAALAVFLLTFVGFGVKAGLVPVNFWLPRAYTAAPSAFVPVLAGVTLNLGLYGIVRVNADLLAPSTVTPGLIALVVGTVSALVGILYATTENDLKTLLAHSSVENAGIITAGLGAGFAFGAAGLASLSAMAFVVALYHMVNHSLYKALLFIGSGSVDASTGTRDLDRLGGLIRRMPWAAVAVLAGVLSIAALPPFNGFVSEWLTFQTLLRSAELSSVGVKIVFALCGAGLALTAALAVTCFAKLYAMGFLGVARSEAADVATEASPAAIASMSVLAAFCLALGVLPTYTIGLLDRVVVALAGRSAAAALVPPFFAGASGHDQLPPAFVQDFHDLGAQVGQSLAPGPGLVILHRGGAANPVVFAGSPSYLLLVLAGSLIVLFGIVWLAGGRRRTVLRRVCWDGGIRRLLPEMTYTATGFSNPVRVVFQAVFQPTVTEDTREAVAEHFRTAIRREVEAVYVVDRVVLVPVGRGMLRIARSLARMHHGRLNAYLAYVLGALLIALVWLQLTH